MLQAVTSATQGTASDIDRPTVVAGGAEAAPDGDHPTVAERTVDQASGSDRPFYLPVGLAAEGVAGQGRRLAQAEHGRQLAEALLQARELETDGALSLELIAIVQPLAPLAEDQQLQAAGDAVRPVVQADRDPQLLSADCHPGSPVPQ